MLNKKYIWLHKFMCFQDAEVVLAKAFAGYNNGRIHSICGCLTPNEFARKDVWTPIHSISGMIVRVGNHLRTCKENRPESVPQGGE